MTQITSRLPSVGQCPDDLREVAQRLLAEKGPAAAADHLGISVAALLRICALVPIRRGTVNSMRQALTAPSKRLQAAALAAAMSVVSEGKVPAVAQSKKR